MGTPLRRTRRRGVSPFSSDWGKISLYKLRRIVIIELLSFSPRFLTVLEQKIPFYYIKVRNVNAMEQGTAKLDMLHGSIWDKLLRFALPVAATAALGQLFNAADVAVVGNFASGSRTAAVAAVGANGPIINLILGLFIGIALGATVVIANAIGNNDRKSAQNAVHTSMVMAVIGGVIVAIIGELIAGSLLNLLQVPEDVYPLSLLYLRIYFLGMPAILLYNFEAAIFRSIGETKVPLIALAASGVLNVLLNLLFVIGFHMTVNGVAIATVLSNVVSSILLYRKLRKSDQYIHVEPQLLTIHWGSFRQIMRIGLPAGIQSAVFAISNIVIQSAINSLGTIIMDYADALTEAKSGNIPRKRGKLQEQVIALTAENNDLSKRLTKSMDETLEYARKAETLQKEKENNSHYTNIGKELARTNPTEYRRIVHGKPKTIGSFFDSVLSLFTPDVVRQVPRLQQIEAEIEEERKKQEKQGKSTNQK